MRAAHTCTYTWTVPFGFLRCEELVWGCASCQPGALSRLSSCETHSIVIRDEGGPISLSRPMALSNTHTHTHSQVAPSCKQTTHGSRTWQWLLSPLTLMAYVPHALVLSSGTGEQTSWASQDTWWLPGWMQPRPEGTPFNSSRDGSCCRLWLFLLTTVGSNTKTTTCSTGVRCLHMTNQNPQFHTTTLVYRILRSYLKYLIWMVYLLFYCNHHQGIHIWVIFL